MTDHTGKLIGLLLKASISSDVSGNNAFVSVHAQYQQASYLKTFEN